MSNRLIKLLPGLFLLCCLIISTAIPAYAVTTEQPVSLLPPTPPPNPYEEDQRPSTRADYKSKNYWEEFKQIDNRTLPSKDTIGEVYFLSKNGQRLEVSGDPTLTIDDEVALVIQVNAGGRLYLCSYPPSNPSGGTPQGIWLVFNEVNLTKAGTYQTVTFKKLSPIPGKHTYRLWFYDNSTSWSHRRIALNLRVETKPAPPTPYASPEEVKPTTAAPPAAAQQQPANDNRATPPVSAIVTPGITSGLPLHVLASVAGAVVVIAGGIAVFLIVRRRRALRPPPIITATGKRAKLLLSNNMEITIEAGEKWLGRIDFARALSPPELGFISRQHFLASYENDRFYIEDSHSDNGTQVNGMEIRGQGKQELHDGDSITVADGITMTFKIMPQPHKQHAGGR